MNFFALNTLKPIMTISSATGLFIGLIGGTFLGNRHIKIDYNKKKIMLKHSVPLISGVVCATSVPALLISSPLIMIDYFGDLCIADKVFDRINSTYLIKCERYHQYGPADNKYYAPSTLHIKISTY